MFWNKEKKSFLKWLNFAVITMVEHDRVYHHLLEKNLTIIDVEKGEVKKAEIDTSSNNYLSGKYLFRTFASAFIVVGGTLEQKLSDSKFNELQELVKIISIQGTTAVKASFLYSDLYLDKIPADALKPLYGGKGAKFMDKSWKAFSKYMAVTDIGYVSDELVKLYCEALSFCIKDLKEEDNITNAMGMFAGARKAILERSNFKSS